jgi:hypothetical protein
MAFEGGVETRKWCVSASEEAIAAVEASQSSQEVEEWMGELACWSEVDMPQQIGCKGVQQPWLRRRTDASWGNDAAPGTGTEEGSPWNSAEWEVSSSVHVSEWTGGLFAQLPTASSCSTASWKPGDRVQVTKEGKHLDKTGAIVAVNFAESGRVKVDLHDAYPVVTRSFTPIELVNLTGVGNEEAKEGRILERLVEAAEVVVDPWCWHTPAELVRALVLERLRLLRSGWPEATELELVDALQYYSPEVRLRRVTKREGLKPSAATGKSTNLPTAKWCAGRELFHDRNHAFFNGVQAVVGVVEEAGRMVPGAVEEEILMHGRQEDRYNLFYFKYCTAREQYDTDDDDDADDDDDDDDDGEEGVEPLKCRVIDYLNDGRRLDDFVALVNGKLKDADVKVLVTRDEVLALRLYTSSTFRLYNGALRAKGAEKAVVIEHALPKLNGRHGILTGSFPFAWNDVQRMQDHKFEVELLHSGEVVEVEGRSLRLDVSLACKQSVMLARRCLLAMQAIARDPCTSSSCWRVVRGYLGKDFASSASGDLMGEATDDLAGQDSGGVLIGTVHY